MVDCFNKRRKLTMLFFIVPMFLVVLYDISANKKNIAESSEVFGLMPTAPFVMDKEGFFVPPYGLDEKGILYFDYGARYDNLGKYHNPTFVASYADSLYHEITLGNKNLIPDFMKQVDFLLSKTDTDVSGDLYWSYPFENPYFRAPKGWYSGMTSGRILGVLARAHYLTKDEKYLKTAEKICNKLTKSAKNFGMATYNAKNDLWLEEVAYPNSESFKVLNGHIYGLSGLYDYANYINDKRVKTLALAGFNAVLRNLEKFDAGFISYYCENMPGREKSYAELGGYNITHIHQLLYCFKITNNPRFLEKAMRLQLYENFKPEIAATFTTNPETHGTDKMNLTFGNNYWSSYKFPVTVTMDLKEKIFFDAITIIGRVPDTMPLDYNIFKKIGNAPWEILRGSINKGEKIHKIIFPTLKEADHIKVEIKSSNNKQVVALEGIGIQRSRKDLSPIFMYENLFRNTTGNYNLKINNLFNKNPNEHILIKENFEIDLIIPYKDQIILHGNFMEAQPQIQAFYSKNLKEWDDIDSKLEIYNDRLSIKSPNKGFIKLQIKTEKKLRLIELEY